MKYYVLGPKASAFHDPLSGLTVMSQTQPVKFEKEPNKRIQIAVQHRHLIEVDEDFGKSEEAPAGPKPLAKMTDAELVEHYKANFEVSEEDVKTFEALKKKEKIKFLEEE